MSVYIGCSYPFCARCGYRKQFPSVINLFNIIIVIADAAVAFDRFTAVDVVPLYSHNLLIRLFQGYT